MKFHELLTLVGEEPLFSSALFRVAGISSRQLELQLVRWVASGKLARIRRGLYCLNPPYRKWEPHPFLVANRMKRGSYVSLQSVLGYHGMIPEQVRVVTSVTTGRPEQVRTPLGSFVFRHVRKSLFREIRYEEVAPGQFAHVASPEKALLDLVYLTPGADDKEYLLELRLQNLSGLDRDELLAGARPFRSPKVDRAVRRIRELMREPSGEPL